MVESKIIGNRMAEKRLEKTDNDERCDGKTDDQWNKISWLSARIP